MDYLYRVVPKNTNELTIRASEPFTAGTNTKRYMKGFPFDRCLGAQLPIEAESSLGPDSHHPIISLSGIPSVVMVLRILHPILAA